ncbi:hypothetical protein JHK87_044754 [Glycine soja]|nr:hypothetical protein JHK87_044754 [Glycine soja]
MDGKVDDEDTQEVLREAALLLDLNRQQWAKAIKWLVTIQKQLAIANTPDIEQQSSIFGGLTNLSPFACQDYYPINQTDSLERDNILRHWTTSFAHKLA